MLKVSLVHCLQRLQLSTNEWTTVLFRQCRVTMTDYQ